MESFNRGEHVVAAFRDVEKAFNNVWHNGLRHKIFMIDLPTKMTRWLSDFLVGRVIQVNVNGFLSEKTSPIAGYHRVLSWVHYFFWYMSMTYQNLTTDKTQNPSLLLTLFYGLLVKMYNLQQNFLCKDLRKLAKWCAKWRIKLNPEKDHGHHILQVLSHQKFRNHSKTVWWETQNLFLMEISRNYFRLQIHFSKTLRGNPGALQQQVSPNQTFSQ